MKLIKRICPFAYKREAETVPGTRCSGYRRLDVCRKCESKYNGRKASAD